MQFRLVTVAALLMLWASAADAADKPSGIPNWPQKFGMNLPENVGDLVADLGSPNFATREAASRALASAGTEIIPLLRELIPAARIVLPDAADRILNCGDLRMAGNQPCC